MKVGPVFFLLAFAALPPTLLAQDQASLGIGAGLVRYSGGSSFSAFTAAPAVQHLTSSTYLGASGAVSLLDSSVWASQGRAELWAALSRRPTGTRLAVSAVLAASSRSDGVAAASATGLLETVWSTSGVHGGGGAALGAGHVTGLIEGVSGVGALRVRARTWWQLRTGAAQFSLGAEGTRFLGAWYTDVVGGVTVDHNRIVGSLWLSGRLSGTYGSTGAASATLQYFLTPFIALEASGGNYLRDPFQGLPQAGYGAAGIRLYATRRALKTAQPESAEPRPLAPLVAQHRGGDTVVVRFRMPAAQSVAIAGNWNAWTPAPLQGLGDDIWEAALLLGPGTYYFNLVVDGREWVVPAGVAVISDGLGGMLAILNVL
ncbi:MAG TPA: glycogen-binding domain-containing protein [Gemmatimonadales bacterium]|nr:glycogen-binding domain-containing protein [Gemmatimonadales bacterium]